MDDPSGQSTRDTYLAVDLHYLSAESAASIARWFDERGEHGLARDFHRVADAKRHAIPAIRDGRAPYIPYEVKVNRALRGIREADK